MTLLDPKSHFSGVRALLSQAGENCSRYWHKNCLCLWKPGSINKKFHGFFLALGYGFLGINNGLLSKRLGVFSQKKPYLGLFTILYANPISLSLTQYICYIESRFRLSFLNYPSNLFKILDSKRWESNLVMMFYDILP